MLELNNITLAYGSNPILKGVDLSVKRGDVVSIIGPSGTGKTTLLRCIKNMTVLENVMDPLIVIQRKTKQQARDIAVQELERVGLGTRLDHYPSQLSGGQLQRTGIARALAVRPDVMLFDEPTSSLDPELVGEVLKVIKDVASSGITSLLVTHEMQFAKSISNRIVFMDQGVVAAQGTPAEMFDNPTLPRLAQFLNSEKVF